MVSLEQKDLDKIGREGKDFPAFYLQFALALQEVYRSQWTNM